MREKRLLSENHILIDDRIHYEVLFVFLYRGCNFHSLSRELNFSGTTTIKNIVFGDAKYINKAVLAKIEKIIKINKPRRRM